MKINMEIKTKYNAGEEFWMVVDGKAEVVRIQCVSVTAWKDSTTTAYTLYINSLYIEKYDEEEFERKCFRTKEKLLASL